MQFELAEPLCGRYIVIGRSPAASMDDNRALSIDEVYVSFYSNGEGCNQKYIFSAKLP